MNAMYYKLLIAISYCPYYVLSSKLTAPAFCLKELTTLNFGICRRICGRRTPQGLVGIISSPLMHWRAFFF